jgi:molecular chaperone DnaK
MAVIGIDLGTSNSAAAVLPGGRPVMIPSAGGPAVLAQVGHGARGSLKVRPRHRRA